MVEMLHTRGIPPGRALGVRLGLWCESSCMESDNMLGSGVGRSNNQFLILAILGLITQGAIAHGLPESTASVQRSHSDLAIPISNGMPPSLTIPPGTYWEAWQVNTDAHVASYSTGTSGQGFLMPMSYGSSPTTLSSAQITTTSEKWTEYVVYSMLTPGPSPTVTPTPIPTYTPTPNPLSVKGENRLYR